jgi:sugar (pentulose or hexulose) kinase
VTRALLGVDVGTTAVKAVVLATDGRPLGRARATVAVHRPHPLAAEQDMTAVWRAVGETVRAAVADARAAVIVAVGVTGQGDGAWLVDAEGRPVGPALTWLDGRAAERVGRWATDGRGALVRKVTGSALFPGALPVLLEELAAHEPGRLERAEVQLNCKDWVRFRITGVAATDPSEASRTYLDVRTGRYSDELIDGLGHQRFRRLLPPVLAPTSVAGRVSAEAAAELGLPEGIPVATGMVDTPAGGVGLGAIRPGDAYAILGTTAFAGILRDRVTLDEHLPAITLALGDGAGVVECLAPMNGTPNLDWARAVTGCGADWTEVEALVAEAGPGAGGVLYLPYASVSGERAPFVDAAASAGWLGTSVRTSRAQLLRAVYEGVALSLRECMDILDVGGDVRLCGGAAVSPVVCRILADVTGRRVVRSTIDEPGARGAGAFAAVAAGLAPDLTGALVMFGDSVQTFDPDPTVRELHDQQVATFVAVRDALRPGWPRLRSLRAAADTSIPTTESR